MINHILFFCFIVISSIAVAHDHSPKSIVDSSGVGVDITGFKHIESFLIKGTARTGTRYNSKRSSNLELTGYYKFNDGDKFGVGLSRNTGLRHQDDWIEKDGDWLWQDTSSREEFVSSLIYSKKFRTSDTSHFVYEVNTQYQTNHYNHDSVVILRPSTHYFFLESAKPYFSINLALPLYHASNFKAQSLYKNGVYTSFLFHLSKNTIVDFTVKYLEERWLASEDSKELAPGEDYTAIDRVTDFTLGLRYYF